MIYVFDIDGTICITKNKDYNHAEPNYHMVNTINYLYYKGHKIFICTARGTGSGINYKKLTKKQLKNWGVFYHKLIFGRIVSDKVISPEEFLNEV